MVKIPADPAPNGYLPNPYTEERAKTLEYLKTESVSTDGWTTLGTKSGVVMDKKQIAGDSSTVPLVRGRGIAKGITPAQFYAIVSHPGARKFWDGRFLEGHPLLRYGRRAYKFYTVQKGAFMVQPRDFVGYQDAEEEEDGTLYIFQTSVPDDAETGPVSGKTRATLTVSGWALRPSGEDTDVTYLVKVNPNGSLPSSIVNVVVSEIPQCVVTAIDWAQKTGLISYVSDADVKSVIRNETYVHEDKRKLTFSLTGAADDEFSIFIDNKTMYKSGYTVTVTGEGKDGVQVTETPSSALVKVSASADGKKFEIVVRAK